MLPPLRPRQRADVYAAVEQHIVDAHERREFFLQLRRRYLAVEPLLQVVEGGRIEAASDQQLPVEHRLAEDILDQVGKALGDVVAGAREQRSCALAENELDADAVPFPLGREIGRIEHRKVLY